MDLAKGIVLLFRSVLFEIGTVCDNGNLFVIDSTPHDVTFEGIGEGHDMIGPPDKNVSTPSSRLITRRSFNAPTAIIDSGHRSRISRTQGQRFICDTKKPAMPQKNCGDASGDNNINVLHPPALGNRRKHVGYVVEGAFLYAFVGAQVRFYPQNSNPVFLIPLVILVLITGIEDAVGMVGRAGDNRHSEPGPHPALGIFIGARGRGVDFGGEIVGRKQYMHMIILFTTEPQRSQRNDFFLTGRERRPLKNSSPAVADFTYWVFYHDVYTANLIYRMKFGPKGKASARRACGVYVFRRHSGKHKK